MTNYKDAGVDVELGDDASRVLYEAAKRTWENRKGQFGEVLEFFPDFSGLRAVRIGGLPTDALTNLGFDGVGTKIEIAERIGRHDTVAYDLFAMVCDDAIVRGAEPVMVGSILDVNSLGRDGKNNIELVKQLAQGYIGAAKAANVVVVNGEVAELGARVHGAGDFNYNWGAGVAWFGRESKLLKGTEIKKGDSVVAFKENGFRSNGLSLVRKIMESKHGVGWVHQSFDESLLDLERPYETQAAHPQRTLGEMVLEPSIIYTRAVSAMFGGFLGEPRAKIHGVAHITGGGILGKLGRVLKPSGFGAVLDNLFAPPSIMKYTQSAGGIKYRDAYKTWNMGNGMLIITPEPDQVIAIAAEHDIKAQKAGNVVNERGIIIERDSLRLDFRQV